MNEIPININFDKASAIYHELMNGRVINKTDLINNNEKENELYIEIINNLNSYKVQYAMSGFELVAKPGFFFIREANPESIHTKPVKKIQTLLLIIARYITTSGYKYDLLTDASGGISPEQLADIASNADFSEIIKRTGIDDLMTTFRTHLLERGLMYETGRGTFILSVAGRHFFDEIFSRYKPSDEDTKL